MGEFKPITTQEEFNTAIQERINRVEEKYKGYEELKQQNTSYAEKLKDYESLKTQISTYEENAQKSKATIDELNSKIKGYEASSVKTRIALETGLPYDMASRLKGDDEKAIREDAESLAKIIKVSKQTPPYANAEGDQVKADDTKSAFRNLAKGIKKGN